jgi:hypothetical protein
MVAEDESTKAAPGKPPGALAEVFHTWRYFFLFLGLIALVLLFYAEENWRGHWVWSRYRGELEAQGVRLEPSAYIPRTVPPEANFAEAIWRASGLSPRYDTAVGKLDSDSKKRPRSNSWMVARIDLGAWQAAFLALTNSGSGPRTKTADPATNRARSRAEAAAGVLAALSDCDAAIAALREASQRPYARFDLAYDVTDPAAILLPHLAPVKKAAQVVALHCSAELGLRRTDEAFRDVLLLFSLADATRDEPLLISQLVRFAILAIALQPLEEGMDQWADSQLASFQQRLQQFDLCRDMRHSFEAEAFFIGNREIDYMCSSRPALKNLGMFPNSKEASYILLQVGPAGWFDLERVNYLRMVEERLLPAIDVERRQVPPKASRQLQQEMDRLSASPGKTVFRHQLFAACLLSGMAKAAQRTAFTQTGLDAATVACALQRYRLAEGQFPQTLEALVPRFIAELPRDIINGQPLHYRHAASDEFVLYSVGWNETDEGGTVGVSTTGNSPNPQSGDWVWTPFAPAGAD